MTELINVKLETISLKSKTLAWGYKLKVKSLLTLTPLELASLGTWHCCYILWFSLLPRAFRRESLYQKLVICAGKCPCSELLYFLKRSSSIWEQGHEHFKGPPDQPQQFAITSIYCNLYRAGWRQSRSVERLKTKRRKEKSQKGKCPTPPCKIGPTVWDRSTLQIFLSFGSVGKWTEEKTARAKRLQAPSCGSSLTMRVICCA